MISVKIDLHIGTLAYTHDLITRLGSKYIETPFDDCNRELVLKNSVQRRVFPQGSFFRFVFFLR